MKAETITLCQCGKFLDDRSWKKYSNSKDLIIRTVKEQFPKAKVSVGEFEEPDSREKKEVSVKVTTKDQTINHKIYLKLSKCNLCEKEGTNYFEAILQVRSKNTEVLEGSVKYLQDRVASFRERGLFINKIERLDEGFDLWMTSSKLAQVIGRELVDYFGGEFKASPRLFTRNHQTSKKVYRVSVLIELPGFTRGDILAVNDKVWIVEKLGKKVKLIELATGSSIFMDYQKLEYKILHKEHAYVSRVYPVLEVINPHDYQSSMVKNKPKHTLSVGEDVRIVIHRGIYVVD